jgi:hypothetical protein
MDRMAATFGPACWLPMWIQFFLLCTREHKRRYVRAMIMCSFPLPEVA